MNAYIPNQTRNLKANGLALLVASSLFLSEGCATNRNNYTERVPQKIVYGQQKESQQAEIYSNLPEKKERNKVLKFFDKFFSTGALSLFTGF
jgi:hypothetical protein